MTARYRDPLLMTLVAAFFFLLAGGDAGAQANRTIKIVVAVPPGGTPTSWLACWAKRSPARMGPPW